MLPADGAKDMRMRRGGVAAFSRVKQANSSTSCLISGHFVWAYGQRSWRGLGEAFFTKKLFKKKLTLPCGFEKLHPHTESNKSKQ